MIRKEYYFTIYPILIDQLEQTFRVRSHQFMEKMDLVKVLNFVLMDLLAKALDVGMLMA